MLLLLTIYFTEFLLAICLYLPLFEFELPFHVPLFEFSFCQKKLRTTPQSKDGGDISYPCKVRWISLYNQPLKVSSLLNGSTLNFQIPCKKFLNCGIVKNTYWKHETKEVFLKFSLEIMYGGVFVIVIRDNKKSKNTGWITSLKGYPKHCL